MENRDPDRPVTRADFVGAAMVEFLRTLIHDNRLDEYTRSKAELLCEQWDSVSPVKVPELASAAGETK